MQHLNKIQEIDWSVKDMVGPKDDIYYKNICGVPIDAFEPDLCHLIKHYLNEDGVYFDIGANVGGTVVPIGKYLRYGLVYAFEPSCAYDYLVENVKMHSLTNAKLFNIALGEENGEANFKTGDCLAHSHRLSENNYLTDEECGKVKIERLNDIIKREKIEKIDFVKLDVEGYEKNVLEGCDDLIKNFNPIFYIEFNSWCLIAFKDESPRNFLKFLCEKFTHIYWIKNCHLTRLDSESKLMDFLHSNLTQNGCVDNLVCLNGDIELRRKYKVWFNANMLSTEVGKRTDSLFCPQGKSGCLSYGPYVPLSTGKYKVIINFLVGGKKFDTELGRWDIYINKCDKVIASGTIIDNDSFFLRVESEFEITSEFNNASIEIRTYSNGNADMDLKSIMLEYIRL